MPGAKSKYIILGAFGSAPRPGPPPGERPRTGRPDSARCLLRMLAFQCNRTQDRVFRRRKTFTGSTTVSGLGGDAQSVESAYWLTDEAETSMTKRMLAINVALVCLGLATLLGLAQISSGLYQTVKDFTGIFVAIAAAYLAYCF